MSMLGHLIRLPEENLEAVLSDSSILDRLLNDDSSTGNSHFLDLDKSWEGIIYLLTGLGLAQSHLARTPHKWVFFGGRFVDEDQDLGYGPARYINPIQVKMLSEVLDKINQARLLESFDARKMNAAGIYPEGWEQAGSFEYLSDSFAELRKFYSQAARQKMAVISLIR